MAEKFSCLLSVYRKENPQYLCRALDSILDQTVRPSEIVIVIDGPLTDSLTRVIAQYESMNPDLVKIVKLEKNSGLGMALNEGLKNCCCDLIARMDTDDISKPDRFEKQLAVMSADSTIDVISSWIDEFEGTEQNIISTRKLPETHPEILKYARKRNPVNHPVVMFRKNAVQQAGGYRHLAYFEDYFLWARMLMNGAKFYNISESLLLFRTSTEMYKRRGGWRYAKSEIRLQTTFLKMGFISIPEFLQNVIFRLTVRMVPHGLRKRVYKSVLR